MSSKIRQFKRQPKTETEGISLSLSLGELIASQQSLQALLAERLPIQQAFRLSKIVKAGATELEQYEAAKKLLLDRYAEKKDGEFQMIKTDAGETIKIQKGKEADLENEHQELLATTVTLPGAKLKAHELGDITIAPVFLFSLSWLLDD